MQRLELVIPDRFELITMDQEPSADHALTYVIPEGDHNPKMVDELRLMIARMLSNMASQHPAGLNNDVCRFHQPRRDTTAIHMTHAELDQCMERLTNPLRNLPGRGVVVWGNYTRWPGDGDSVYPVVSRLPRIDEWHIDGPGTFSINASETGPLRIFEATAVLNILLLNRFLKAGDAVSVHNKELLFNAINHVCRMLADAEIVREARVYPGAADTMEFHVVLSFYMQLDGIKVHIGTPESVNTLNRMCDLFLNQGK